jgi:hypothetical protein
VVTVVAISKSLLVSTRDLYLFQNFRSIFKRLAQILRVRYMTAEINNFLKKVKVKWSRYRPGVAQRVGRGIALLFHDSGTRRGWVVSSTPQPHFTLGKDPVPILQEAGWALGPVWTGGKSRPHRDSINKFPSQSHIPTPYLNLIILRFVTWENYTMPIPTYRWEKLYLQDCSKACNSWNMRIWWRKCLQMRVFIRQWYKNCWFNEKQVQIFCSFKCWISRRELKTNNLSKLL